MRYLRTLLAVALFASIAAAQAQSPKEQLRALQEQAVTAYKAGNFAECAKNFAAALAIRPHHPRLLYNFAACSAKAGKTGDALRALTEYADMGLIADVEKDDDFASLRSTPAFNAVLDKIRANGKPIGESRTVARLNERFLAEGIAFDPESQRFFVSSVDQRKIVTIDANGDQHGWQSFEAAGLVQGAFGMAIDRKRGVLWVASSGVPQVRNLAAQDRGANGVFSFRLIDIPRIMSIAMLPSRSEQNVIGDVAVLDDGAVYATDSIAPSIYAITNDGYAIDTWLTDEIFGSLQGLTSTPDNTQMIVADYARGLHFIDRTTKATTTIGYAGGTTLLGIDGLYRTGNRLIAIQNGVAPIRILSMVLDASGHGIAGVNVISANDPNITEPSLGTIKGDEFCVVANAQWSRFNDDGTRKQDLDPPYITCIKVK